MPTAQSYVDQLNKILIRLGKPSEDTLRHMGSPRVRDIFSVSSWEKLLRLGSSNVGQ